MGQRVIADLRPAKPERQFDTSCGTCLGIGFFQTMKHPNAYVYILVVLCIQRRTGKLGALSDDLLDSVQEISLGSNLPPGSNGEHARFRCHGFELSTSCVGTQPGNEVESDVAFYRHTVSLATRILLRT